MNGIKPTLSKPCSLFHPSIIRDLHFQVEVLQLSIYGLSNTLLNVYIFKNQKINLAIKPHTS